MSIRTRMSVPQMKRLKRLRGEITQKIMKLEGELLAMNAQRLSILSSLHNARNVHIFLSQDGVEDFEAMQFVNMLQDQTNQQRRALNYLLKMQCHNLHILRRHWKLFRKTEHLCIRYLGAEYLSEFEPQSRARDDSHELELAMEIFAELPK